MLQGKNEPIALFWFRRDLRLDDNTGLCHALENDLPVLPVFIFDTNILDDLQDEYDARVTFIYDQLADLNNQLKEKGTTIICKHDAPVNAWKELLNEYDIQKVYANRDYEPYAKNRDKEIADLLEKHDIQFNTYKDHVIFEGDEIVKGNGDPYVVFTPYSRQWLKKLTKKDLGPHPSAIYFDHWTKTKYQEITTLDKLGFKRSKLDIPSSTLSDATLKNYKKLRDYPAGHGTSRLGIHLRFGTISIRKLAAKAKAKSNVFLNELIWREFYSMILHHFPRVVNHNFKKKYDAVKWRNSKADFKKWCEGKTGYPLVDAGMRQLNQTGYMHNRVRMVVASFLTKHLLIDWRWGEAYFAEKLLDYELASNNGGWQWAAGTGTDAQPYFRIFNPQSQKDKFDPDEKYIKKWVPEYGTDNYMEPMVEHKKARERALGTYKKALN